LYAFGRRLPADRVQIYVCLLGKRLQVDMQGLADAPSRDDRRWVFGTRSEAMNRSKLTFALGTAAASEFTTQAKHITTLAQTQMRPHSL
jgi:hypothetical protein